MELMFSLFSDRRYKNLYSSVDTFLGLCCSDINPVVDNMIEAVSSSEPELFYRVGPADERFFIWLFEVLPEEIVDLIMTSRAYLIFQKIKPFIQSRIN